MERSAVEQTLDRIRRAAKQGWVFEDTRMTPGVPLMGARNPQGEVAGIVGYWKREGDCSEIWELLNEAGVPQ